MEVDERRTDDDDDANTSVAKEGNLTVAEKVAQLEDTSKTKAGESTITTYFLSGANTIALGSIFMLFISTQLLASGCDYWVAFW